MRRVSTANSASQSLLQELRRFAAVLVTGLVISAAMQFDHQRQADDLPTTTSIQQPVISTFLPELEFAPTEIDAPAAASTTLSPSPVPVSATLFHPTSSNDGDFNE